MAAHPTPIDISNMPDLVRLTKQVETTRTPLELKRENKIVAVLTPMEQSTSEQAKKKAIEEVLALAGAWGERDWNEVEAELDHIRHSSKPTPPFTL